MWQAEIRRSVVVTATPRRVTRLLIPTLVLCAVATQVADLATAVARLVTGRTVARDVATLVAVIARHVHVAVALLRAVAGQMATLVAVVATRIIRRQAAVACDMATAVAPVAPVQVFLAVACEVSHLVTLVALLPPAKVTTVTRSADSAATASTNILTVASKVTGTVTLEASVCRHHLGGLFVCSGCSRRKENSQ